MKTQRAFLLFAAFCIMILLPISISAKEKGPVGVGLVVGSPSGLSLAWRMDDINTIQAAFAWSFMNNPGVSATADYLFHFDDVLTIDKITIPLYAGLGVKLDLPLVENTIFGLGLRIPLGARWVFTEVPLELFLEIAPGMRFIPESAFDFGFCFGGRWYF